MALHHFLINILASFIKKIKKYLIASGEYKYTESSYEADGSDEVKYEYDAAESK